MAPILSAATTEDDDTWKLLSYWRNDAVIPFVQQWLCWVDYSQGILFWDVFQELRPAAVSFLRFLLPGKNPLVAHCCCAGVSVVNHGRALKFVKVAPMATTTSLHMVERSNPALTASPSPVAPLC
jgi:hypothetical protein